MANIDANLNDIEAWGGESTQLPPGPYQFKIKSASVEAKQSDKGDPTSQLIVEYEVLSGVMAGKPARAYFSLNFTKDVPRKRLKSLVQACGIPVSPTGGFDSDQLVGCRINADVVHEEYESTKVDPLTGQSAGMKTAIRVVNERPYGALGSPAPEGNAAPASGGSNIGGRSLPGLSKA